MNIGEILDNIISQLPVPRTVFEGTWFLIGWLAGNCFGAQLDEDMLEYFGKKYGDGKKTFALKLLAKTLNFLHHAWIGLLGVIYFGTVPIAQSIGLPITIPQFPNAELFWLFLGLALEDIQYHVRASLTDGYLSKVALALKTKSKK